MTEALRLAAASQLLLVVGLLLRGHRRSRVTSASSLLAICVVCYLALPLLQGPGVPALLRQLASVGAFTVPFAFWLAARVYFEDSFQPKPVHGALLLGLLAARAAVLQWPIAVSAIGIAAVVDALRRIHAGSSSDLLLSRLRLRYVILLGTGLYALLVLVAEATVERGSRADGLLSAANDAGLFVLVGTISMMILRVEPDLVRAVAKRQVSSEPPTILEKRLEQLIEEEQVFKTVGLTIDALAESGPEASRGGRGRIPVRVLVARALQPRIQGDRR